jgi:hypothetical protein
MEEASATARKWKYEEKHSYIHSFIHSFIHHPLISPERELRKEGGGYNVNSGETKAYIVCLPVAPYKRGLAQPSRAPLGSYRLVGDLSHEHATPSIRNATAEGTSPLS